MVGPSTLVAEVPCPGHFKVHEARHKMAEKKRETVDDLSASENVLILRRREFLTEPPLDAREQQQSLFAQQQAAAMTLPYRHELDVVHVGPTGPGWFLYSSWLTVKCNKTLQEDGTMGFYYAVQFAKVPVRQVGETTSTTSLSGFTVRRPEVISMGALAPGEWHSTLWKFLEVSQDEAERGLDAAIRQLMDWKKTVVRTTVNARLASNNKAILTLEDGGPDSLFALCKLLQATILTASCSKSLAGLYRNLGNEDEPHIAMW